MRGLDDIDEATVTLVDRRLAQGFQFMRDVLENPALNELIPDSAELVFRDVPIGEVDVRLTAYPAPDGADRWEARITGPAELVLQDSGPVGIETTIGETPERALDALETSIRAAVADRKVWHAATG
jgi:hypothetical protein